MTEYANATLAIVGALYTIASVISSIAPKTKLGLACAKVALALRHVTSQKPPCDKSS